MTKVLVLGAYGMLGHVVFSYQRSLKGLEVKGTVRRIDHGANKILGISSKDLFIFDASKPKQIEEILNNFKPNVIINCIGDIICDDFKLCFLLNSYLPQYLSRVAFRRKILLIHISSDGVFDGKRGKYKESDIPDSEDNYGLSKASGEMLRCGIVIRTSLIGQNITDPKRGLIDWLINSDGEISGFTDRIWSGVTTLELCKNLNELFSVSPHEFRIIHLAGQPLDKFRLLEEINKVYDLGKKIKAKRAGKIDRSLVPTRGFSTTKSIHNQLLEYERFERI